MPASAPPGAARSSAIEDVGTPQADKGDEAVSYAAAAAALDETFALDATTNNLRARLAEASG